MLCCRPYHYISVIALDIEDCGLLKGLRTPERVKRCSEKRRDLTYCQGNGLRRFMQPTLEACPSWLELEQRQKHYKARTEAV